MTAVADTSPIIWLAKVDRPALLSDLFGEVLVPPAVMAELRAKPDVASAELERLLDLVTVRQWHGPL